MMIFFGLLTAIAIAGWGIYWYRSGSEPKVRPYRKSAATSAASVEAPPLVPRETAEQLMQPRSASPQQPPAAATPVAEEAEVVVVVDSAPSRPAKERAPRALEDRAPRPAAEPVAEESASSEPPPPAPAIADEQPSESSGADAAESEPEEVSPAEAEPAQAKPAEAEPAKVEPPKAAASAEPDVVVKERWEEADREEADAQSAGEDDAEAEARTDEESGQEGAEITEEVIGYCARCRAKRAMVEAVRTTTRKGKPAIRGHCEECHAGMFVFTTEP